MAHRTHLRHPVAHPHLLVSGLRAGGMARPELLSVRAATVPLLGILDNGNRGCPVVVRFGLSARAGPLSRRAPVPDPDRPDHLVHLRWHGADPARGADAEGGVPDRDRGADRVGRDWRRLLAARRLAGSAA